ncbi:hypothetical protein KNP414_05609 [Paenibacillus mucilaginosus KNP414]|uniref:Uncharacterized protein n=1 Tax=Paenibacillus mucilaginosus (strain KNP414) TaxID=1036673 RepID=F8FLK6_PAEMK|nr:hypothetical protein KNP414_05609 [Paenibacillus mucilaginosus KNP414]
MAQDYATTYPDWTPTKTWRAAKEGGTAWNRHGDPASAWRGKGERPAPGNLLCPASPAPKA